jgi:hypothetical protein
MGESISLSDRTGRTGTEKLERVPAYGLEFLGFGENRVAKPDKGAFVEAFNEAAGETDDMVVVIVRKLIGKSVAPKGKRANYRCPLEGLESSIDGDGINRGTLL